MFLLFTSDASMRYQQDALDATAYPTGHVIRFRYHESHVDPSILKWKVRSSGFANVPCCESRDALLIYAECHESSGARDFAFRPLRFARVVSVCRIGSAIYVVMRLSGYPVYNRDKTGAVRCAGQFQNAIASIPFRPIPPIHEDKGLAWYDAGELRPYEKGTGGKPGVFCLRLPKRHSAIADLIPPSGTDDQQAWEGVVEALGATRAFAASTFYRVAEICQPRTSTWCGLRNPTAPIKARLDLPEPEYHVLPGHYSLLSCRMLRPKSSTQQVGRAVAFEVSGDALNGPWPKSLAVDSRYNEQQVILSSKRVLDRSVAVLTIVVPSADCQPSQVVGLRLAFLFSVSLPKRILWSIFICFLIGPVMLSLGPDSWDRIFDFFPVNVATTLKGPPGWASLCAAVSKLVGGFIVGLGAFIGFRRLPLRS